MLEEEQIRKYLEAAPLGRLATVDAEDRPHVVPVCFALIDGDIVIPIDEKPQDASPEELQRVRNIQANPQVSIVVDHYAENWSDLGWVQLRGTAAVVAPEDAIHTSAVTVLRRKYNQYRNHALKRRPIIRIRSGSVRSWGSLEHPR